MREWLPIIPGDERLFVAAARLPNFYGLNSLFHIMYAQDISAFDKGDGI